MHVQKLHNYDFHRLCMNSALRHMLISFIKFCSRLPIDRVVYCVLYFWIQFVHWKEIVKV